jgi:hypothetical protein
MWQREDHKAKRMSAGDVLAVRGIIDITPTPEALVNRRATREQLERHHARRAQAIELRALEEAQRALEPVAQTWWARMMRRLRGMVTR